MHNFIKQSSSKSTAISVLLSLFILSQSALAATHSKGVVVHKSTSEPATKSEINTVSASSHALYANTIKTHWSISAAQGNLGFGNGQTLAFALEPQVEYFVMDRLAVGGVIGLSTNLNGYGNSTAFSIGPSATYHFWNENRFSAYGSTNLLLSTSGVSSSTTTYGGKVNSASYGSTYVIFNLSGGANYNFAPWFGIGPRVTLGISSAAASLNISFVNLFFYI